MKTRLTKEQSQHLIDLGVPKEKASDIEEYDGPVSQWIHRGAPIFKLEDFFNGEILPKWIDTPEDRYSFAIQRAEMGEWVVGFRRVAVWTMYWKYEELIDSLYQLACWYYGEFLKSEGK